jgi:hypothetical protein
MTVLYWIGFQGFSDSWVVVFVEKKILDLLAPFFWVLIVFFPPEVIPLLNWAFQVLRLCFCQQVCMTKISDVISTSNHADVYTNCILTGGSAKRA